MRNSFVVEHSNGKAEHFICSSHNCNTDVNGHITKFYSYQHAIASGWIYIKDVSCSPPEDMFWICPNCYKKRLKKEA